MGGGGPANACGAFCQPRFYRLPHRAGNDSMERVSYRNRLGASHRRDNVLFHFSKAIFFVGAFNAEAFLKKGLVRSRIYVPAGVLHFLKPDTRLGLLRAENLGGRLPNSFGDLAFAVSGALSGFLPAVCRRAISVCAGEYKENFQALQRGNERPQGVVCAV